MSKNLVIAKQLVALAQELLETSDPSLTDSDPAEAGIKDLLKKAVIPLTTLVAPMNVPDVHAKPKHEHTKVEKSNTKKDTEWFRVKSAVEEIFNIKISSQKFSEVLKFLEPLYKNREVSDLEYSKVIEKLLEVKKSFPNQAEHIVPTNDGSSVALVGTTFPVVISYDRRNHISDQFVLFLLYALPEVVQ